MEGHGSACFSDIVRRDGLVSALEAVSQDSEIPSAHLGNATPACEISRLDRLFGYAELLRKRFWTLSVWEDNQSLMDFVEAVPHGRIMQQLAPHMGKTRFEQWAVQAEEIPLKWPASRTRILSQL